MSGRTSATHIYQIAVWLAVGLRIGPGRVPRWTCRHQPRPSTTCIASAPSNDPAAFSASCCPATFSNCVPDSGHAPLVPATSSCPLSSSLCRSTDSKLHVSCPTIWYFRKPLCFRLNPELLLLYRQMTVFCILLELPLYLQ